MCTFDAIVLGAGAAGLLCAAEAGKRGRRVLLLEHTDSPGKKILISGGGRCNFTNIHTRSENFLSANPHFAKSALARYTPAEFVALVEKHRIPYHEKKLGQLFCDGAAAAIVNMLLEECRAGNVILQTATRIQEVRRTTVFELETSSSLYSAPALVVATGGLSIPKIGATSFGYDLARPFGLHVISPRPSLVPLVFHGSDRETWCDLAGVAADVQATFGKQSFKERMLITHRGLSGPAILQISSYWDMRSPIAIRPTGELPRRLAQRWSFEDAWELTPAGTEGYGKAEVTGGGVDTDELSSKTLESRKVPGLFFIGEVVDVTGHLGGFNFQWAWASAYAAAQAL